VAAARLAAARAGLAEISERVNTPVENLISPDLVRRTLWKPPAPDELAAVLAAGGARPWQVETALPVLRVALDAREVAVPPA
jgi:ribonuclease D